MTNKANFDVIFAFVILGPSSFNFDKSLFTLLQDDHQRPSRWDMAERSVLFLFKILYWGLKQLNLGVILIFWCNSEWSLSGVHKCLLGTPPVEQCLTLYGYFNYAPHSFLDDMPASSSCVPGNMFPCSRTLCTTGSCMNCLK